MQDDDWGPIEIFKNNPLYIYVNYWAIQKKKAIINLMQEAPFKKNSVHLQGKVAHIPGNQDKENGKQNVVAPISFFMCDQKDTNKKKLKGNKKGEIGNKTKVHP